MSEHEHHHEHDHDHCHDHEHEHHHGGVEVHEHEGAVAASFRKEIPGNGEAAKEKLREAMKELAKDLKEKGAFIGHIKACVRESDEAVMLSITKDILDEKTENSPMTEVTFAAIVFNIEAEELEELAEEVFDSLQI